MTSERLRANRLHACRLSRRTHKTVTLFAATEINGPGVGLMVLFGEPECWICDGYRLVPIASYRAGEEVPERVAA